MLSETQHSTTDDLCLDSNFKAFSPFFFCDCVHNNVEQVFIIIELNVGHSGGNEFHPYIHRPRFQFLKRKKKMTNQKKKNIKRYDFKVIPTNQSQCSIPKYFKIPDLKHNHTVPYLSSSQDQPYCQYLFRFFNRAPLQN